MKVVFISSNFETIVELPSVYFANVVDFYQAFIDFKYNRCLHSATTEHFLKHHYDYNVYLRTNTEVALLHIGNVEGRYREAEKYFKGAMTPEEISNVQNYLNYWFS